jgi:hypothetical protein
MAANRLPGERCRMATKTAPRHVYDPGIRKFIRATGTSDLFPELSIPRSTVAGWLRSCVSEHLAPGAVQLQHMWNPRALS